MTPRRVVAKVEWHPGEYPRVGFIVTNMTRPAERVVAFYNQRGTAEQWIKEGKNTVKWTAVMLLLCRQRRPASASCAGLQSRQLHLVGRSTGKSPGLAPIFAGTDVTFRRGLGCNGRKASVSSGRVPCSSSKSGPTSFALA